MRVCPIILCLFTAGSLLGAELTAAQLFAKGRKAEASGHMAQAYLLYSEAAAKEPGNQDYWLRSQALRTRAEMEEKLLPPTAADTETGAAPEGESSPALPPPSPEDIALLRQALPPATLKALPGLKDFDLKGNATQLFEAVAQAFGLECIFDSEYQPGPSVRFHATGVNYRDALHDLEAVTGSFLVPITERRFMVVKDTQAKRNDLEREVAVEVRLPDAINQQELTEIVNDVKQAMDIQHVSQDTRTNTIILRDRISKVLPARDVFQNFMRPRAQVMLDIRLIEVSRNSDITYGITLPTQFPVMVMSNLLHNTPSIPSFVNGILTFGGGRSLLGLGIADASMVATMSLGTGAILLDSTIRTVDAQAASLHVGDRYPILTSSYSGGTSTTATGANGTTSNGSTYVPPPAFSFEDLGLTMKITPMVHGVEDVSLDIDAAFKVLSGTSLNGLPIISNRQIKSQTQLKFGEWAMIAGLLDTDEARSIAGIAGLARIPLLSALTSTHNHTKTDDRVLILIEPRLITPPPSATPTRTFHLGSDTRPITPL